MSVVKNNLIANFVGSAWIAIISIAFIPIYIGFMGIESYGLVGFYITLQALFAVLDMGLTATVSRELAKLSADKEKAQGMRNLVRTMEIIYWLISIFVMFVIFMIAPWVEEKWLNEKGLSPETVQVAITLMGFLIGARMLYGFYSGGILGLQRQVLLNVVKIVIETCRSGGVVLILWLVSPTITVFFLWQLGVTVIGVFLMSGILWRCLPKTSMHSVFQVSIVKHLWRFAAGIGVIAVLASILIQMDKVVLSKMLSLEAFAYYSLASVVAMGLYVFISPVFSAIYPRFTQMVANNDEKSLVVMYHSSCQLVTVLVVPVAITVSFFSEELLMIWTQDEVLAKSASPILSILIIGTALNGMMNMPFALQLAYGWTRLSIYMNLIALVVLVPSLIFSVNFFGAVGAAIVWLALNAGYIVFGLRIMHQRLLNNEFKYWILYDFMLPTFVVLLIIIFSKILMPDIDNTLLILIYLLLTYLIATLASIVFARNIRKSLRRAWLV